MAARDEDEDGVRLAAGVIDTASWHYQYLSHTLTNTQVLNAQARALSLGNSSSVRKKERVRGCKLASERAAAAASLRVANFLFFHNNNFKQQKFYSKEEIEKGESE